MRQSLRRVKKSIEKVLKENKGLYLVKYKNFDECHNEWLQFKDVTAFLQKQI